MSYPTMKCGVCLAKWVETYPEDHPMYGVCPGRNCPAPRLSKTGEVDADGFQFSIGDTVTPVGWMLETPKPQGRVIGRSFSEYGQRLLTVSWSDGRTSKVAEAVVEVTP